MLFSGGEWFPCFVYRWFHTSSVPFSGIFVSLRDIRWHLAQSLEWRWWLGVLSFHAWRIPAFAAFVVSCLGLIVGDGLFSDRTLPSAVWSCDEWISHRGSVGPAAALSPMSFVGTTIFLTFLSTHGTLCRLQPACRVVGWRSPHHADGWCSSWHQPLIRGWNYLIHRGWCANVFAACVVFLAPEIHDGSAGSGHLGVKDKSVDGAPVGIRDGFAVAPLSFHAWRTLTFAASVISRRFRWFVCWCIQWMDDWRFSSSRVAHSNVRGLRGLSLRVRRRKSLWFLGWIDDWRSISTFDKLTHGAVLGLHDRSAADDRCGSVGWLSGIRFSGQKGLADSNLVHGHDGLTVGSLFGFVAGPCKGYSVRIQVGTRHGFTVGSSLGIRDGMRDRTPLRSHLALWLVFHPAFMLVLRSALTMCWQWALRLASAMDLWMVLQLGLEIYLQTSFSLPSRVAHLNVRGLRGFLLWFTCDRVRTSTSAAVWFALLGASLGTTASATPAGWLLGYMFGW